jgi:cell division protein FtsX
MKKFQLISYKDRYYWYAVAGVICALYLLGFFAVRSIQGNNLAATLRAQVPFSIVLKATATEAEIFAFQKELRLQTAVQAESVQFISKTAAWQAIHEQADSLHNAGDSSQIAAKKAIDLINNPLPDVIELRLRPAAFGQMEQLLADWRGRALVADIWYSPALVATLPNQPATGFDRVLALIGQSNVWLIFVGGLLCFLAAALLRNTLRWHILAHKQLINNLYIMGAPADFIENLYLSVAWKSAALAIVSVWSCLGISQILMSDSDLNLYWVDSSSSYIVLYLFLALAAVLIFVGGAYRSVAALGEK